MKSIKILVYSVVLILLFSVLQNRNVSADGTQVTVAGTIRNIGQGWYVINDSVHIPINITNVKTLDDRIAVWHSVGAKTIHTMTVTPDETMVKEGYTVGVSGGTYYSYIFIYDKNHNIVSPKDYKNYGGNIWIHGLLSK